MLRPLRVDDERDWQRVRRDNAAYVQPWEPTLPPGSPARTPVSFRQFVRDLDSEARADRAMPWCIEVGGRIVGQVHLFGIVRAAQQSGAAGYWLDESVTGQGIATRALALAVDHALGSGRAAPRGGQHPARQRRLAAGRRASRPARRGSPASASCTSTARGETTAPSP